ncbi:unnamed protein product [Allacma fusca]|uniref:VWFA domain-containing protein n=1 Tax=Allacma fusca TaxID=39272 RepID=A0A8J2K249_9HEXA|nr:unnamed protein product [Allacma fusca]
MKSFTFQLVTVLLLFVELISAGIDQSLVENAKGKNVVELVVEKIQKTHIFDDDYGFLRRIAYVETKDGEEISEFPRPNYGGLWNVAEIQYNRSKDFSLTEFHGKIKTEYNINWIQTAWQDLLKPLYSGLAARLFLQSLNVEIPQKLEDQAKLWDQRYSRHDLWDNRTFINRTDEYDDLNPPCSGKMDLVIVLDGSGSVGEANFELCKRFVIDLIGSYSLKTVRHGFVIFASEEDTKIVFELDNFMEMEELKQEVLKLTYPDSKTHTNVALQKAFEVFSKSEPRQGAPRVMTIFTDGESNPKGVENIELLKKLNVSSYAVGISDQINYEELQELAYGNQANVFTLENFEVLAEFFRRINEETCKVPQKPALNEPVEDALNKGEKRYYSFSVPEGGITIALEATEGQIAGYYSLSENNPNPSSAFHDGILAAEGTFIHPIMKRILDQEFEVYLSVEGFSGTNNYVIEAMEGYQVSSPPTTEESPEDPDTTTEGEDSDEESSTDETTDEADEGTSGTKTTQKPEDSTLGALSVTVTMGLLILGIVGTKVLTL